MEQRKKEREAETVLLPNSSHMSMRRFKSRPWTPLALLCLSLSLSRLALPSIDRLKVSGTHTPHKSPLEPYDPSVFLSSFTALTGLKQQLIRAAFKASTRGRDRIHRHDAKTDRYRRQPFCSIRRTKNVRLLPLPADFSRCEIEVTLTSVFVSAIFGVFVEDGT